MGESRYYGQDISDIKDELILLLQVVVTINNDIDVKEDALQLLGDYTWGPYPILEEHFEDIENELKPDAEYVINAHRIAKIEQIMVSECKRIYEDIKKEVHDLSDKVWILHNKNLTMEDLNIDVENKLDIKKPEIEMSWLLKNGVIKNEVCYFGNTFSQVNDKGFFVNPEMHFHVCLREKRILLAYYFGKRLARCMRYDLRCVNGEYVIENPQNIC